MSIGEMSTGEMSVDEMSIGADRITDDKQIIIVNYSQYEYSWAANGKMKIGPT